VALRAGLEAIQKLGAASVADKTIVDAFVPALTAVDGVALEDQEAIVGEAEIAAAVFNHLGAPVGAVGVAGPVERLLADGPAPDVVAAVRETARSLSREMGAGRVSARAR